MATTKIDEKNNIRDYLLALDDLGQPKVLDLNQPDGKLNSGLLMIARLIIMKKGSLPDFPDMGIDIIGRYRFAFEPEVTIFTQDLNDQIATYLPELIMSSIECELDSDKRLMIYLSFQGNNYLLIYNTINSDFQFLTG